MKETPDPLHKVKLPELTLDLPKDYIEVCCPSCNSPTAAADMNIHDKVAKCSQCNVLFPIQNEINSLRQHSESSGTPVEKTLVHRPVGIDIFRYKGELDFTFQESKLGQNFIFVFLLIFALSASFIYAKRGISIWIPIGFWISTVLSALSLIISSKTTLHIDRERLTIKRRPKWSKDIVYSVQEIDQIYTKQIPDTTSHSLHMIINSVEGQKHVLLAYFDAHSKAKYLEQEIENHLGIPDRPVPEAS